jgi:hypothetical protein
MHQLSKPYKCSLTSCSTPLAFDCTTRIRIGEWLQYNFIFLFMVFYFIGVLVVSWLLHLFVTCVIRVLLRGFLLIFIPMFYVIQLILHFGNVTCKIILFSHMVTYNWSKKRYHTISNLLVCSIIFVQLKPVWNSFWKTPKSEVIFFEN